MYALHSSCFGSILLFPMQKWYLLYKNKNNDSKMQTLVATVWFNRKLMSSGIWLFLIWDHNRLTEKMAWDQVHAVGSQYRLEMGNGKENGVVTTFFPFKTCIWKTFWRINSKRMLKFLSISLFKRFSKTCTCIFHIHIEM